MRVCPFLLGVLVVAGCATTSGVMEVDNGTYLVSARAASARGGTAGASALAYEEAQKFCGARGQKAVVVSNSERDIYQSSSGASWNASGGSAFSGSSAAGRITMNFRCVNRN
jgi:hypothetical protein